MSISMHVNSWSTDMQYAPGVIAAREAKAFIDSVAWVCALWPAPQLGR